MGVPVYQSNWKTLEHSGQAQPLLAMRFIFGGFTRTDSHMPANLAIPVNLKLHHSGGLALQSFVHGEEPPRVERGRASTFDTLSFLKADGQSARKMRTSSCDQSDNRAVYEPQALTIKALSDEC